jgi:hypothetical protein
VKRSRRYIDTLRALPAFRSCSPRDLTEISRLIDTVDLPAGTVIGRNSHEVVLMLEPTRVLVVERRAWSTVMELARVQSSSS